MHADASVTLHLGYGRVRAGQVGDAAGFDAYALRTSTASWKTVGAAIAKVGESVKLAQTRAYEVLRGIGFDGAQYRTDIGHRAVGR